MIDWQALHFIRPEFLFAIIPLLLLVWGLKRLNAKRSGWQGVVAGHLYQHLIVTDERKAAGPPFWLLALCWVLAAIAAAGPSWQKLPQPVYQVDTGKIIVMDMSLSMRSSDLAPDRLSRAKFKAIDLINSIEDGEIGLVVYAGDAFTVSPLTADKNNLRTLIPSLRPEIMPVPGSYPIAALEQAESLLLSAGYTKGEIYWLTDGIGLDDIDDVRALMQASKYQYSILAIGTEQGAPITLSDGALFKDSSGTIVVPKLNQRYLQQASSGSRAKVTLISSNDNDIKRMKIAPLLIDSPIANNNLAELDLSGDQWQDMGAALALIMLPFAAYAFRRGVLVLPIVISSMLMLGAPSPVQAQGSNNSQTQTPAQSSQTLAPTQAEVEQRQIDKLSGWFKNDNQKAMEAFNNSAYEKAATLFDDPMWRAAALYKQGDYAAALSEYEKLPQLEALYNKANSMAHLGQLQEALDTYDQVLSQNAEHENALKNRAIVEQMLQQQQQDQQDESGEQGEQDPSQNSEGDGEGQKQNGDPSQQEQQNGEQGSEQEGEQGDQQNSQEQGENASQQKPNEANEQADSQQDEGQNGDEQNQPGEAENEAQNQEAQQAAIEQKALEDMSPEEREQMQRMQTLLNKVPDDPAYLLQRKMLLESQQRRRDRLPSNTVKEW